MPAPMPAKRPQDDPDWQIAHAEYLFPDADDPDQKFLLRVKAVMRMHEIECEIADRVQS